MCESLRDLPVVKPEARVTYVSTSDFNKFWVISSERHILHDFSFTKRRVAYMSTCCSPPNVYDVNHTSGFDLDNSEGPATKIPRVRIS
ncbi:hypothetical protein AHF37_02331 [Paragonimus kellicotti]|nr:hypothetical protein AHF37_02331 [Paragonimus kellicotti]